MNFFRWFMALLLVFLLAACASTGLSDWGLEINGIEISNRSSSSVESFLLAVPKDGIEVSVNRIAEGSSSLNKMKAFPYQKNKVHIRWFQDGIQYTKDVLTLREEVESDTPVTVVIELHDSGKMVAYAR